MQQATRYDNNTSYGTRWELFESTIKMSKSIFTVLKWSSCRSRVDHALITVTNCTNTTSSDVSFQNQLRVKFSNRGVSGRPQCSQHMAELVKRCIRRCSERHLCLVRKRWLLLSWSTQQRKGLKLLIGLVNILEEPVNFTSLFSVWVFFESGKKTLVGSRGWAWFTDNYRSELKGKKEQYYWNVGFFPSGDLRAR